MPDVSLTPIPDTKWKRELRAFHVLFPELLERFRDQFVAIHEGKVVGFGTDQIAVGLAAYRQFGAIPILVRRVTLEPPSVARIA